MKNSTRKLQKALLVVCTASFALLGGGCTDKREDRILEQIALSRSTVVFAVNGGSAAISVAAPDTWTAQTPAAWLDIRQEGTSLTITAAPNDETTSVREASIEIASGIEKASVTVRQEPAAAISIEIKYGDTREIDSEGGTYTASVSTDAPWSADLLEKVEGWQVATDTRTGICRVEAAPNTGQAKNGTLVITAGTGPLARSERLELRQISRAENPYYKFTGSWGIYAPDWYQGKTDLGEAGIKSSCRIDGIDYGTQMLGMYDFFIKNSSLEILEFDRKSGKVTVPLGYLVGSTTANGYVFYLYLVALDLQAGKFATNDIYGEVSDDGKTIRVSDLPPSFKQLGLVGYNGYIGYTFFNNLYYACAPGIELRRDDSSAPAPAFQSSLRIFDPGTLPAGVPLRLPKNTEGTCRMLTVDDTANF